MNDFERASLRSHRQVRLRSLRLGRVLLGLIASTLIVSAGCSGGDAAPVAGPADVYTVEEVESALTDEGVEFVQRAESRELAPPELGKPDPAGEFTLLSGAMRDATGEIVYRFDIRAYVYRSVAEAVRVERDLLNDPDDFGYLNRRFGNVIVSVKDFTLERAPGRLPSEVLHAMTRLRHLT
jgi:hypothetical protein